MYREEEVLDLIEILPEAGTIQLRWSNRLFKNNEIINVNYRRTAYSRLDKEKLLSDAPHLVPCITLLGW